MDQFTEDLFSSHWAEYHARREKVDALRKELRLLIAPGTPLFSHRRAEVRRDLRKLLGIARFNNDDELLEGSVPKHL